MLRSRLVGTLACCVALSLPVLASLTTPAQAAPTRATTIRARQACTVDHQLEVAIGVPGEAIGSTAGAGVVEVRYTCKINHAPQALRLPTPHAHDALGTSLARGYFNDDGYEDVAVGVPGLDVSGHADAGGVAVFYGSASGLRLATVITQSSPGVPGSAQSGARFGAAVAADGYGPDRTYVLRIGEPGKTVSGHKAAGGFVDLPYVHGKLTKAREVTLASTGIPGSPGTGDLLGTALTGSYAVGAPGRTVDGHAGAGAVLVSYLPASTSPAPRTATLITQASPGIPGTPETGDHFGAALSRHWIGVPGEAVGDVAGAGVVDRYYFGSWADNPGFTPAVIVAGAAGVPGSLQADAHFGASVTELGFYVDDTEFFAKVVLVGAPGATVSGHTRAGTVTAAGVNEVDPEEGNPFSFTGQYQLVTAPALVANAGFGTALAQLDEESVSVGAPGANGGRVEVYATTGEVGLPLTHQVTWTQQAGTPETGDAFGAALGSRPN